MKSVKLPIHEHRLLPITRFSLDFCKGCQLVGRSCISNIYGGYRCNELGCESVFHKECAESLPEINHSSHPDHPLKLLSGVEEFICSVCRSWFLYGYECSICDDFKLDLRCSKGFTQLLINSNRHEHPLELFLVKNSSVCLRNCIGCWWPVVENDQCYGCHPCEFFIHLKCAKYLANHSSHPQHQLKLLTFQTDYADNKCLLCEEEFKYIPYESYHCDVCNFTICPQCMHNPPPACVESPTTHEHELHLVPRHINFTCNACGTLGDRSPYFCLQCNFMIHRRCIDLPRVININRHDHRISYTRRLGNHREWKCRVCRKNVNGFYGAYTCVKCPSFVVHSLCATKEDVWDIVELEGTPDEEEEIAPFVVIDDNTIKHFSHDHNLLLTNKDGHDRIQPEDIVCEACRLQILSETFYRCKQCNFILHENCANYPRKKRHVISNLPLTLLTDYPHEIDVCQICTKYFSGFRYKTMVTYVHGEVVIDVRCAAITDTLEHGSHQHPLYYFGTSNHNKPCNRCGYTRGYSYDCDECDYSLDGECAQFPKKVMRNRYDDHPLFLSFGDMDVDGDYWCEACETKVNSKEWFYSCYDCGTILHTSCVMGDVSYVIPGSRLNTFSHEEVVSNTSSCRPLCSGRWCNSRCKLPFILKISTTEGVDAYFCSTNCSYYK